MTSPSQLKYLDAIGIPVWVSRELVSDVKISIADPVTVSEQNVSDSSKISSTPNQSNSTAQSILKALNEPVKPHNNKENIEPDSNTRFDNAVTESVTKAHIPNESNNNKLSTSDAIESTRDNLLFKSAQHYIFASGNKTADWMIIGHSPEPFNGIGNEPFAEEAGELLSNMLRAVTIEFPRQQAYMVNVIDVEKSKDQSLANDENIKLNQKLISLINKVNPKILLLVGQLAAQNLLQSTDPLIIMRSKIHQITDTEVPCIVTYYPSYLLQKPIDKRKAWNDMKLAMSVITDVS